MLDELRFFFTAAMLSRDASERSPASPPPATVRHVPRRDAHHSRPPPAETVDAVLVELEG